MRRRYREKTYKCGDYLEVNVYPVFEQRGFGRKNRKKRYKPTSAMQEKLNQKHAEQALTRILNANFTEADISVTLTFRDDCLPETFEEAERLAKNFLRRVKRLRAKLGLPEMKYVIVPGGGRFHFHIPMSGGIDAVTLSKLWKCGYLNVIHFQFSENGLCGHANYIASQFDEDEFDGEDLFSGFDVDFETGEVKESEEDRAQSAELKRKKGKRRYSCSKNIVRPEGEERDGRISAVRVEELATVESGSRATFEKLYPGYCFSECQSYYNEENGGYYLAVKMYKEDAAFLKSRKYYRRR